MLRAVSAGIQGWRGKPRRLPAEETLQFEKKNSSHPHRGFPGRYRHCKDGSCPGSAIGRDSLQAAFRPECADILRRRFDFRSRRLRFFFTCLFDKENTPPLPRLSHSRPRCCRAFGGFFMKQPFCAPSEALRRVLDAAAALPRPAAETLPLDEAVGRIAAETPVGPDGPAAL